MKESFLEQIYMRTVIIIIYAKKASQVCIFAE